jgi:hypothetical protein
MNVIQKKAHMTAANELLEMIANVSALAIIADCIWIVRDVMADGLTVGRSIVMILLFISCFFMVRACIQYHNKQVKTIVSEALKVGLKNAKTKHKRTHK